MEFQLGVGVLNFLCLVTLRIEQGETKKEWNGKVQIGAGGDSETERDRIKDWGWRRNGSGRVGRRQKGKGGGHEAAVEKGAVEVVCLGNEWLLTRSRVVSDRDLRHRPPGRRSQAADMNPKNISIVSLPLLRVKHETALEWKPKRVDDEKLIEWLENLEQARTEMWSGHLWTRPADAIDPGSHQSGKDFWIAFANNMRFSKRNVVCFIELCIAVLAIMLCCHEAVKVLISRQELGSAPLLASRPYYSGDKALQKVEDANIQVTSTKKIPTSKYEVEDTNYQVLEPVHNSGGRGMQKGTACLNIARSPLHQHYFQHLLCNKMWVSWYLMVAPCT